MVYNVTPYMDYHPGGEEELMKAAGIDGTDMFDQVWTLMECFLNIQVCSAVFLGTNVTQQLIFST